MNKGIFRLVFDAQRGMRVPAAECTRGHGKQPSEKAVQGGNRHGNSHNSRHRTRLALAVAATVLSFTVLSSAAYAARPLPSSATLTPQFNLPQAAGNFNQLGRATQGIDAANA